MRVAARTRAMVVEKIGNGIGDCDIVVNLGEGVVLKIC